MKDTINKTKVNNRLGKNTYRQKRYTHTYRQNNRIQNTEV